MSQHQDGEQWRAALRLACWRLGLSPQAFWALSVREWQALVGPEVGPVLTRGDLEGLMQKFPDEM